MPRGIEPKGEERNENKYQRYKKDWGGIKKAIGAKTYREAVLIEASIIEDRLTSFLYKIEAFKGKDKDKILKTPLMELVKMWKSNAQKPLEDQFYDDLHQAVRDWATKRNRIAHGGAGSVKSLPGEEHPDPGDFEAFARETAIEGERIVKSVMNWYRREKDFRRKAGLSID